MTVQSGGASDERRPKWAVTPWPWADQAVGAATAGVLTLGLLSATFVGKNGVQSYADVATVPLVPPAATATPLADPLSGVVAPLLPISSAGGASWTSPAAIARSAGSRVPASIAAPAPAGTRPAAATTTTAPPLSGLRPGPSSAGTPTAPPPFETPPPAATPSPAPAPAPLPALPLLPSPQPQPQPQPQPDPEGDPAPPPVTIPAVVNQLVPAPVQGLLP